MATYWTLLALTVSISLDETADFIRQVNWPSSRLVGKPIFIEAKSDSVENVRFLDTRETHQQLVLVDVACPGTGELLREAQHRIYHRTRNSMESGLLSEEIGIWCNGTIEDKRAGRSVSVRRKNLQQLPLRTTLLYTDNQTNRQIDTHNRISYMMINILYRFYINATFVKRYSTTWCYPDQKTGDLIGVCVDLVNNHSEVGAFMFLTTSRLKLMDFIPLSIPTPILFIFKAPKLSITNNIYQLPFDPKQGCLLVSKSAFQRTVVMVSVIGLMFLHISYSSKIFSLIQAPSERIDSLTELLNSRLEVSGDDLPYNHFFLSTSTEPVRKALYEQKLRRKDGSLKVYSLEEGVSKIQKGLFAFHAINTAVVHVISETFDETEKCFIRELKFIDSSDINLAVQKNFTFREHFQVGIAKIRETGVYKREFIMYRIDARLNCVKGADFQPLNMVDVRFAAGLIGGGLLGALVLLVMEIAWNRYKVSRLPVFEYVN
ncbi:ionotropic glutamate receptor [Culex quinquefasciatus]|uniref:Ionotropic glutamate receptor n=1 Tax=Culex quinquefasciatus TaxID=7176 RepID=B0W453_CULQU|nr:ionotropic glutamate receptor [Culex quinquefasciatus]|eukprot:XP_001843487.1 ionotropic glutamate receptor [Culex quinquefasciatus]